MSPDRWRHKDGTSSIYHLQTDSRIPDYTDRSVPDDDSGVEDNNDDLGGHDGGLHADNVAPAPSPDPLAPATTCGACGDELDTGQAVCDDCLRDFSDNAAMVDHEPPARAQSDDDADTEDQGQASEYSL